MKPNIISDESWGVEQSSWDVVTVVNEHGDYICEIKTSEVDDEDYQEELLRRSGVNANFIECAPTMYRMLVRNFENLTGGDRKTLELIEKYVWGD